MLRNVRALNMKEVMGQPLSEYQTLWLECPAKPIDMNKKMARKQECPKTRRIDPLLANRTDGGSGADAGY
jgi:hypothetical protein